MIKRIVALAVLTGALSGCAHNAEWMHRQPAVESALGTDPNTVPVGKVYGPRAMGVASTARAANPPGSLRS
jgi:hypothetical protein